MDDFTISKMLDLHNTFDRAYLLEKLNAAKITVDHKPSIVIDFLINNFNSEWLIISPPGFISIQIEKHMHFSIDFFSKVVPLIIYLLELKSLTGHAKLVKKLNINSYERLSTILEAITAGRYRKKGYTVELEPESENGKFADFRVLMDDKWIYFECKKWNSMKQDSFLKRQKFAKRLIEKVQSMVLISQEYRIDFIINSYSGKDSTTANIIHELIDIRTKNEFGKWRSVEGIRFAINLKKDKLDIKGIHQKIFTMLVGPNFIQVNEEHANTQVIFGDMISKERQKARELLKEARNQIPNDKKGIIILEIDHPKELIAVAEERLKDPIYKNIIAILLIGNGAFWVKNLLHPTISESFVRTSVLD